MSELDVQGQGQGQEADVEPIKRSNPHVDRITEILQTLPLLKKFIRPHDALQALATTTNPSQDETAAPSDHLTERRKKILQMFTENIYKTRAVQEERTQRAEVYPDGWFWFSSRDDPSRFARKNPQFLTEGTLVTDLTPELAERGFYTEVLPRDHDGHFNTYMPDGIEIMIVAPPDFLLEEQTPAPTESVMIFPQGMTFKLVATEDVEITIPEGARQIDSFLPKTIEDGKYTDHIKRYYVVPEPYFERYHEALHHETTEVVNLPDRKVDVIPQQYAPDEQPHGGLGLLFVNMPQVKLGNISLTKK